MKTTSIYDELKTSYLLYSCSIFNRALPNIIDGLKTAQRRIILGLKDLNLSSKGSYKKVSRLEGHVLGCYHPNGGCAGTAINMGQCDSFRYPLTDIHGNVGGSIQVGERVGQSLDESPPAAARYLEIKSTNLTDQIFLKECDKWVSSWRPNYDNSTQEINYFLPSLPALLINGATGIATGFAANHVSYNALEVLDATIVLLDKPNLSIKELRKYVKAPDFTHYPRILDESIDEVLEFGTGTLYLYGEWEEIEIDYKKRSKRPGLKITSLASGNSERFIEMVYKGIEEEKISGIAEVSNLSSRFGIEILITLKAKADTSEVLSELVRYTNLSAKVSVNATGLLPGENIPRKFGFKEIVKSWYKERSAGLVRRFSAQAHDLSARLSIVEGLLIIINDLENVIEIIKNSSTIQKAEKLLSSEYKLTTSQAKAILEMSLKSLVKKEYQDLFTEKKQIESEISRLNKLISSEAKLKAYIKKELTDLKLLFKEDKRRTKIIDRSEVRGLYKKIEPANPHTLKDIIISEGKELGMSSRLISKFISENAGGGIKEAWDNLKKNKEFTTPVGIKMRKQKLAELKSWALENGLPTKGKKGWNAFMLNKEHIPFEIIKKEMKKWLTTCS